jgi:putative membrane protein
MIVNFESHASNARTFLTWPRIRHLSNRIGSDRRLPDNNGPVDALLLLLVMALFFLLGSFAAHVAP